MFVNFNKFIHKYCFYILIFQEFYNKLEE